VTSTGELVGNAIAALSRWLKFYVRVCNWGLDLQFTVRVPLIKRCVLRHGAKVQSSTLLVHWLWREAAKRPLAYSSVYCTVTRVVSSRVVGLSLRLQCAHIQCPVMPQS
jgi:hypothetical protein